ncbi:transmembrane protein 109 [Ictalurus furcatus]|uniref:transmembrane protein 109 n=1 Tax=Ictalurus furcatus TaxID=66913 RepID=UPI00234FCD9C|nr:transmembrane protein 109 [Ictalurus furcatus]
MILRGGRTESAVWKKLLGVGLLVLTTLTVRCEGGKMKLEDTLRTCYRLTDVAESLRLRVDSVVGAHTTEKCLMVLDMALHFVAEGAAGGLNVITVYVAEILRATGVGDPVSIPHFTPEGMAVAAKWMLLALISYWLLCAVLRLTVALLRRGFWMLKIIVLVFFFSRIISDPKASSEITLMRLFLLVMFTAVWSVATGRKSGTDLTSLESRLARLEDKVAVMEKCKNGVTRD